MTRNVAQEGFTTQSSVNNNGYASKAVDGNTNMNFDAGGCSQTRKTRAPWWRIDFVRLISVHKVIITNRGDCCGK